MTAKQQELLSAFVDGELNSQELDELLARVDVITFRGTLGLPDKRSSLNSIPDSYRERTAKRAAYL